MGEKFRCIAGGHIVDADDIKDGRCPIDGTSEFLPLVAQRIELIKKGTSTYISFHKSSTVGRDSCRIFGDDYKYVSSEQFELYKKEEGWEICGKHNVLNYTFLNRENIEGECIELNDGDEIFIGNSKTDKGLKLNVQLKREKVDFQ